VIGIRIRKALALNEYITSCLQDEHANHATSERFFFFTTLGPGCFTTSFAISLMLFSMKSPSYLGMQTIEANGVDSNCESRVLPLCHLFCHVCRVSLDLFILFRFYIGPTLNGSGNVSKVNEQPHESKRTRMT
jgi:hypothetical protein